MTEEELAYWYWLSDVKGVGPTITKKLIGEFGSPFAVFKSSRDELLARGLIRESMVESIQKAK